MVPCSGRGDDRRVLIARLVSLVVPSSCVACGGVLAHAAEALCPGCRAALPWLRGPLCPRCALPAHVGGAAGCPAAGGPLDAAWAPLAHEGPARALVPVPTDRARRRARGFDHAARLAAAVGRRTGRPVEACLRRSGASRRQLGASRAARVSGGRVGVAIRGVPPPVVALVDDVHTTGATLGACAAALRAGGARRVVAVTYARALSSPGRGSTL